MALVDGRFLTIDELFDKAGGESHVRIAAEEENDLVAQESRIQSAFGEAENEASASLSPCFVLPLNPLLTPNVLKGIIARAFQYYLATFVNTDVSESLLLIHEKVLSDYKSLVNKNTLIEGLVRIIEESAISGASQLPSPLNTPHKLGRLHGMLPASDLFIHLHRHHEDRWH